MAVRQWVVVFPKHLRYFLDRDADCLKRVAWEARRLTAQAPDSACVTTRVRFLVWRGIADGLNVEYCDCYDLPAVEPLVATGTCAVP